MTRLRPRSLLLGTAVLTLAGSAVVAVATTAAAAANPGPGFPAHYSAPYAEMWNSPSTLMAAFNATGNKYYTLAFIISQGTCNAIDQRRHRDHRRRLEQRHQQPARGRRRRHRLVRRRVRYRARRLLHAVSTLQAQYKRVIDQFNLTRVDLDIEGAPLDNTAANDRRNQALANLQAQYAAAGRTLAVDYTLPVNPDRAWSPTRSACSTTRRATTSTSTSSTS